MKDNNEDYISSIKRMILATEKVSKDKPRKELSPKEKKKCKSCKYYSKGIYIGDCRFKGISVKPLNVSCNEYIKRKK